MTLELKLAVMQGISALKKRCPADDEIDDIATAFHRLDNSFPSLWQQICHLDATNMGILPP
jgi:hypothetical protein